MKNIFDKRESIFATSLTETFILMLFLVLTISMVGFKTLNEKEEALLSKNMELESLTEDLIDKENKLISINEELKEFKDKNRGPDVCGNQNDKNERLINVSGDESIILFNIEFSKSNNRYTLYFYPLDEHLNNEKLNIVTPNILRTRFDLKFNKNGNINFNELRKFLKPIKDSRRINQDDPRCITREYQNKGLCLECNYQVSVKDKNVSASDLKQVYKFLEGYFYVRKD